MSLESDFFEKSFKYFLKLVKKSQHIVWTEKDLSSILCSLKIHETREEIWSICALNFCKNVLIINFTALIVKGTVMRKGKKVHAKGNRRVYHLFT